MRITVLSGKGGVGKSMIASSLAILFSEDKSIIAVDCDVDAPNLALWLGIDTTSTDDIGKVKKISTVEKPDINNDKCTLCKQCVMNCRFGALQYRTNEKIEFISYRCEGCGLCEIVCPNAAIQMKKVNNCELTHLHTEFGFSLVQGQIMPGEAESGKAVTEIREYADDVDDAEIVIQDAAAGIGCPVIASIVGSDYVIGVVEPTQTSWADLKRVLEIVDHFEIHYGIVINKFDLNKKIAAKIRRWAGLSFLGEIDYNKEIMNSIVHLDPLILKSSDFREELLEIKEKIVTFANLS